MGGGLLPGGGGDFLAKPLDPEGPPPAPTTLPLPTFPKEYTPMEGGKFVCYGCGTPESPLPLNPGQGSDSLGKIAATRSISVRGQRSHGLVWFGIRFRY